MVRKKADKEMKVEFNPLIKGIDMGNSFFKTHNTNPVVATVEEADALDKFSKTKLAIEYNEKKYMIGNENATRLKGIQKYKNDKYKVALMSMIALDSEVTNLDVKLVLGVPAEDQAKYGDAYAENALAIQKEKITVNGREYTITVNECAVVPQSYVVMTKEDVKFPCIILDIGGGTLDFSIWIDRENPIGKGTLQIPFDKYVYDFIEEISDEVANVSFYTALKYMDNPEKCIVRGKAIDLSQQFNKIANKYAEEVYAQIIQHEDYTDSYEIMYIMGGCANAIKDNIKAAFEIESEDAIEVSKTAQLDNALAYYYLGASLYEDDNE